MVAIHRVIHIGPLTSHNNSSDSTQLRTLRNYATTHVQSQALKFFFERSISNREDLPVRRYHNQEPG